MLSDAHIVVLSNNNGLYAEVEYMGNLLTADNSAEKLTMSTDSGITPSFHFWVNIYDCKKEMFDIDILPQ